MTKGMDPWWGLRLPITLSPKLSLCVDPPWLGPHETHTPQIGSTSSDGVHHFQAHPLSYDIHCHGDAWRCDGPGVSGAWVSEGPGPTTGWVTEECSGDQECAQGGVLWTDWDDQGQSILMKSFISPTANLKVLVATAAKVITGKPQSMHNHYIIGVEINVL